MSSLAGLWDSLLPVGRHDGTGGYRRYSFTAADSACRDWFIKSATERGLRPHCDRSGNLWAWWDCPDPGAPASPPARAARAGPRTAVGQGAGSAGQGGTVGQGAGTVGQGAGTVGQAAGTVGQGAGSVGQGAGSAGHGAGVAGQGAGAGRSAGGAEVGGGTSLRPGAIVTGSHLDSVPDGGAFDGPLGVASGFAAIDELRRRRFVPARPVAVAAFCEEEGGRFGVACLGSRLLTGVLEPQAARALTDGSGVTLAAAMTAAGLDPGAIGPDDELVGGIAAFVELHIEQGSALAGLGAPVGIAECIWPHGRWRLDFAGRADHAGTTRLEDRRDPMLPYAATVLAARRAAAGCGALATFGKVRAEPGGANGISSSVHAWLDARAPDEAVLAEMLGQIEAGARAAAADHDVRLAIRRESFTPLVRFDQDLRGRLASALAGSGVTAPVLPTGAGHDAGVLAARIPAAMLFVRNPSGVSHSPAEHAAAADCEAGVTALAAVLEDLAGR